MWAGPLAHGAILASTDNAECWLYVLDYSEAVDGVPKEIRKLSVKWSNQRHRIRVNKTMHWALNSGYAVEIIRKSDDT